MTNRNSTALRTSFAFFALFSAAFFWGGNAVASKILYRPDGAHFDAVALFVARAVWSFPLFLTMAWFARPDRPPPRKDWLVLIATGVCFGPLACGSLALAAQYTSGSHVVMLMSLGAPLTAVLSAIVLKETVAEFTALQHGESALQIALKMLPAVEWVILAAYAEMPQVVAADGVWDMVTA